MNKHLLAGLTTLCFAFSLGSAMASEFVGTLTRTEGKVVVYAWVDGINPKQAQEQGDLALFEKKYYRVHQAKVGDPINNGSVIWTSPDGKARVLYGNGDEFTLGPGSSFRISWDKEGSLTLTKVQVLNGAFRGVISPVGPRKAFRVQTHAATMGVRGTDFFVIENASEKISEFSVLRGEVAVQPAATQQEIKVQKALTVDIHSELNSAAPVVQKTNRGQLEQIKDNSQVAQPGKPDPKISTLEKKAVKSKLEEIKTYTPELYARLTKATPNPESDEINTSVIEELRGSAPEGKARVFHGANPMEFEKKGYDQIDHSSN